MSEKLAYRTSPLDGDRFRVLVSAACWLGALIVSASVIGCRRSQPSPIAPEPPDAFVVRDAGPSDEDCLASCRTGVCSACPTVDVAIGALVERSARIALTGRHLAWRDERRPLALHDLCAHSTTVMDCGPSMEGECAAWLLRSDALYYAAARQLRAWSDGHFRVVQPSYYLSERFEITADGRVYDSSHYEDHLNIPIKSGWAIDELVVGPRPRRSVSHDSQRQFIAQGEDVYYVDGTRILREGHDRVPSVVVDYKGQRPRAPIAKVGDALFVVRDAEVLNWFPEGDVAVESVRDGVARQVFTADAIYCFAANSHGAMVCRDQDLQFFPFDGGRPRRALGGPVVVLPKEADLTHAKRVSLSEDGGIAWFSDTDPKTIHVRTPPRSVLCGGPDVRTTGGDAVHP